MLLDESRISRLLPDTATFSPTGILYMAGHPVPELARVYRYTIELIFQRFYPQTTYPCSSGTDGKGKKAARTRTRQPQ